MSEPKPTNPKPHDAARTTRLLAGLVLIPSVPMLCFSLTALLLFYASPSRLDRVLAILPGDQFLRLALFFAPATLFAIVVMALLYALEPARPAPVPEAPRALPRAARRPRPLPALVAGTLAALLLSVALLLLSFVAPGRFGLLIEPLPGDRYLRPLIRVAPFVFSAALVLLTSLTARRPGEVRGKSAGAWNTAVWSVRFLLIPTIPLLLVSLGALVLYYAAPSRFDTLMATLGSEAFIRLVLFFAPFLLFAVIALASLYLGRPARPSAPIAVAPTPAARGPAGLETRSMWGVALLSAGLTATAMLGLAGIGVVAYLLLR